MRDVYSLIVTKASLLTVIWTTQSAFLNDISVVLTSCAPSSTNSTGLRYLKMGAPNHSAYFLVEKGSEDV